jgi:tetratricopeptide (TPR) repeat protein
MDHKAGTAFSCGGRFLPVLTAASTMQTKGVKTPFLASGRATLLAALMVVLSAVTVYRNSLSGPFIYDDAPSITNNPTIRHLWPLAPVLSPPTVAGVGGRPLVNLSLAINHALGGSAVRGYHLLNLSVHVLAGLALLGVTRRTLRLRSRPPRSRVEGPARPQPEIRRRLDAAALPLALAAAVLWTVHPLQTEAVTYVSQRTESLMGLFYLLTLYAFIRGTESSPGLWHSLAVAACLAGVACKEVMVTAPLLVLMYDRTFVAGSFREAWRRHWRMYLGFAGTWLVLGLLMTGLSHRGVGYGLGATWWAYGMTECQVVMRYLALAVWPHPLVLDYGPDLESRITIIAPYAALLAGLVAATIVGVWRRPVLGFFGVWFFAILAPASSVVPVAVQPMAEHRMYLPLAAVLAAGAAGLYILAGRRSLVIGLALGAGWGCLTLQRNETYRTELAIWADTVAQAPDNARAHNNLGLILFQAGRLDEALDHYEQAVRLKPGYADGQGNYGCALFRAGRIPEALDHLETALRIRPDSAEANYNLGNALFQLGQREEGIALCETALRLDPDSAEAHYNLGNMLYQDGRREEGSRHYQNALQLKPDYAKAHINLGNALAEAGRWDEAMAHYAEALRLQPDSANAHNGLGSILLQLGRLPEAQTHFEQALQIRPDYAPARRNLEFVRQRLAPPADGPAP